MKTPFIISGKDQFKRDAYPNVHKEIDVMVQRIIATTGTFKSEILISFLKDHCININWVIDNKQFVEMITSGYLKSYHTERLFDSKRSNKAFLADFEKYIETALVNGQTDSLHSNILRRRPATDPATAGRYYACAPGIA